jgi:hypothetical protein
MLYCHLWAVRLYHVFPRYLIKGNKFGKVMEHKIRVLIFSATLSEIFLILRRIQRDVFINVRTSSCKLPVIFVRF